MTLPPQVQQAIDRQWSIIPVRADKRPAVGSWKPFQDRRPTAEEIGRWAADSPPAWAVVTGGISGIVILDFDGEQGKRTLERLGLRPHLRTGSGGYHVYYRHPGHFVATLNSKTKRELGERWPGLDIRADGGYAVFTGRNSTGPYEWMREPEPDSLDTIPADVREYLGLNAPALPKPAAAADTSNAALIGRAIERARSDGRNNAGFWLACQLRDRELSEAEAAVFMRDYAAQVPTTNTKGAHEPYQTSEAEASLREAYARGRRESPKRQSVKGRERAHSSGQEESERIGDFKLDSDGLYQMVLRKENNITVEEPIRISPFLRVEARSCTFDETEYGRLVSFKNWRGEKCQHIIPSQLLYGDGTEALHELLRRGFEPSNDRKAMAALKSYISQTPPQRFSRHVAKVGWQRGAFVFPNDTIHHTIDGEEVIFYTEETIQHRYAVAGSLDDWRENVARLCGDNSRLLLAVSAAFAAPLMHLVGLDNAGIHFKGPSSVGKTTALIVAGSVCGGHPKDGFIETWRGTANGHESQAALHNDMILPLDEIGQASAKEISEIVYFLGNGRGKSRSRAAGGLRAIQSFRVLPLSTGERSIEDVIESGGTIARGGHGVRIVEVPADGQEFGVFEELHEFASGGEFSAALNRAAKTYYGSAIRDFLAYVAAHPEEVAEEVRQRSREFYAAHTQDGMSSEVGRVLKLFSHIAAVGELATRLGTTGWKHGEAAWGCEECFRGSLDARGGLGARDVERGITQTRRFIEAHASARMMRLGSHNEEDIRIQNFAGWIDPASPDNGQEETLYYFPNDTFRVEVVKGFDVKQVAAELYRRGLLETSANRGFQYAVRLPDPGTRTKALKSVYAVRARILEIENGKEN